MQLFYLINGWAGRSELLDGTLRFFYVGAVPLLLTALAAFLILAPRRRDELNFVASRRRIAAATLLSFAACALIIVGVSLFQTHILNGTSISPRPFMTHWVHPLVIEPNDNSFPCFEVMFAAAAATLLWANLPAAGVLGWCAVFLLAFARTFCGMNYVADSVAGAILGGAVSTFALAALRVPLQLPTLQADARRLKWRVRHQAVFAALSLFGFMIFAAYSLTTSPAHGSHFKHLWGGSPATAAPATTPAVGGSAAAPISETKVATATLTAGIQEGEGGVLATEEHGPMSQPGEMLLASRAARLDGHLPEAEAHLLQALSTLDLPHRIVGVNVAQVRAGNSAYRCAAIRFEVVRGGSEERRAAAETAAQCVKRVFHADAQLQHVDVLGIRLNVPMKNRHSEHTGVRPVFTASIKRDDLIVENKPAWVNWSGLDGGAWLRARSELYIDSEFLPAAPASLKKSVSKAAPVLPVAPVLPAAPLHNPAPAAAATPVAATPAKAKPAAVKKPAAVRKSNTVRRAGRRSRQSRRRYQKRRYRNSR